MAHNPCKIYFMSSTNFIFINGKGSCGKDTQADLILNNLGETAIRISTGDIYREARGGVGNYGKYHELVAPYIDLVDKQGGLLPDDVIVGIVKKEIEQKQTEGKETFIFTGFPRTLGQLELMDDYVNSIEGANGVHIHFDISDETSRERASIRRQKAKEANLPIRPDDLEAVVERRLKTFKEQTYPMLLQLDLKGRLISINAEGTIPEIEKETSVRISKERE